MTEHMLVHVLMQGLIYSLVAMAVYLTSRVIRFDDLTVEGSFGLGGAFAAIASGHPGLGLLSGFCAGALAGLMTGLCHCKLKMNDLISGLVVTTALFSICLHLAGVNRSVEPMASIELPIIVFAALLFVWLLLQSELGLIIRAVGLNPNMLIAVGRNIDHYRMGVLALANALTGLSGALFVLLSGYYASSVQVGTMVIGLASLMLAESITKRFGLALIVGAVLYQFIFALIIELGLSPSWNNLFKAIFVVLLLTMRRKHA